MRRSRFTTSTIALITLLSFGITGLAYADSMAAERYMARGAAAMEEAKFPADYRDAVKEFSKAVKQAPTWADAWFNLGTAQASAKQYRAAIKSFKAYLKKSPKASDRKAVQARIYKLEYKMEKAQKRLESQRSRKLETKKSQVPNINGLWEFWANGKMILTNEIRINGSDIQRRIIWSDNPNVLPPHEHWHSFVKDFTFDGKKFSAAARQGVTNWSLTVVNKNLMIAKFYNGPFGWQQAEWKRRNY